MGRLRDTAVATLLSAVLAGQTAAQCARDALLVFDGSGSMITLAKDPPHLPRIAEARAALARALPDITPLRRVGLLVYGPGPLPACENVDLILPPGHTAAAILAEVDRISPHGDTPLTAAVMRAVESLPSDGIVVLITDGRETCGGGTCDMAARVAAASPGVTIHVIGFKIAENFERWPGYSAEEGELEREPARCLADATGGLFVNTDTVDQLVDALRETLGCAVVSGRVTGAAG